MGIILNCHDCGEKMENVEPESYEIGDVIECEACGAEHEVVNHEPFTMELIDEEK
ncbi:lysine biosynthesis protein LysW [Patescibacteria group bacterium]|nr:lysine biosynthesis protein LysW [Patescibacteria group bacterium]